MRNVAVETKKLADHLRSSPALFSRRELEAFEETLQQDPHRQTRNFAYGVLTQSGSDLLDKAATDPALAVVLADEYRRVFQYRDWLQGVVDALENAELRLALALSVAPA